MLALPKRGKVFVLRADTPRVGISITLMQDGPIRSPRGSVKTSANSFSKRASLGSEFCMFSSIGGCWIFIKNPQFILCSTFSIRCVEMVKIWLPCLPCNRMHCVVGQLGLFLHGFIFGFETFFRWFVVLILYWFNHEKLALFAVMFSAPWDKLLLKCYIPSNSPWLLMQHFRISGDFHDFPQDQTMMLKDLLDYDFRSKAQDREKIEPL
ncbi:hypothetical protein BHM03_00033268 [Ensete ventricosum]|nr:hypothetical protein BHM03_00033268 [Ensete ventricosum]